MSGLGWLWAFVSKYSPSLDMPRQGPSQPMNTLIVDKSMEVNVTHKDYGDQNFYPTLYEKLIGGFIYLTTTHLNISKAMNIVSQFIPNSFFF